MRAKEEQLVKCYKDQSTDSNSYTTKHAIVDIFQLLTLIQQVRVCCEKCQQHCHVTDIQQQGHATILLLECPTGCEAGKKKWASSQQYTDGTFQVNREAVCAVMVTGGEREKYGAMFNGWFRK